MMTVLTGRLSTNRSHICSARGGRCHNRNPEHASALGLGASLARAISSNLLLALASAQRVWSGWANWFQQTSSPNRRAHVGRAIPSRINQLHRVF